MVLRFIRNRQLLKLVFLLVSLIFMISFLNNLKVKQYSYKPRVPWRGLNKNSLSSTSSFLSTLGESVTSLPAVVFQNNASNKSGEGEESPEEESWELDNENIPEISVVLGKNKNGPKEFSPKCAKYPDLYTVQFSNVHWQFQETENEEYFLYSAYLDLRGQKTEMPSLENAKVKVLGMSDARPLITENATLKVCQFWFSDQKKPVFGNITEVRLVWNIKWGKTGHYYPYLISCQIPQGITKVPMSVSLVPGPCDHATNNLNIMHRERMNQTLLERTPKNNFGVCVKALDYPDSSMKYRLVEWIEMLRILGADKIFFYEYFVDADIKKVLDLYEKQGVIDVTQTTLPGELPNQPQLRHLYIRGKKLDKRLTELIPYNDCLYKNMYDFKYVLVMDTDEVIIPREDMNWAELMTVMNKVDIGERALAKAPMSTYCFRNFYFLDGMMTGKENEVEHIPSDFHMLRHVYRSRESTGTKFMKCMHSTEFTAGVHNHFAFFCKDKGCKRHYVDEKRAQMNHFRSTCVADIKNCSVYLLDTEKDDKLWRYKDELISNVQAVLKEVAST